MTVIQIFASFERRKLGLNPAAIHGQSMKANRKNGSARKITVAPSRLQKSAVAGNRLSIIVSFDLRWRIL
jgi:hypothetical protein